MPPTCLQHQQQQVAVLNAKGAVLKPPPQLASTTSLSAAGTGTGQQQQQHQALLPPPSLSGAYLEVNEQGLAAGLPLNPGASLSLPVTVVVGKPPGLGTMFDASQLQVCWVGGCWVCVWVGWVWWCVGNEFEHGNTVCVGVDGGGWFGGGECVGGGERGV